MLDATTALRRMAAQCRSMAATRQTEELRNVFLQMARRYDDEAMKQETFVAEVPSGYSTPVRTL
jgi:hypothetical protein